MAACGWAGRGGALVTGLAPRAQADGENWKRVAAAPSVGESADMSVSDADPPKAAVANEEAEEAPLLERWYRRGSTAMTASLTASMFVCVAGISRELTRGRRLRWGQGEAGNIGEGEQGRYGSVAKRRASACGGGSD